MNPNRRQILQSGLAASVAASLGRPARAHAQSAGQERASLRILILGGTGFLGPALIEATQARGHALTLFNSGRTEAARAQRGRPSVVPPGVEILLGNRDPRKTADDRRLANDPEADRKRDPHSPRGLSQLEGRSFDAVIDTSGFFPRMVRASAELLAPVVRQYVFISSISVYAHTAAMGIDETAELLTLEDPTVEEFGPAFENYGGGKALCEAAAQAAMPGRVTTVRPGFIVGPRDTSRRFLYWPWRTSRGGTMLVPGSPGDPIQFIDVRDLAEWVVHCLEKGTVGVFNATGPAEALSMREFLAGCASGTQSEPEPLWADADFLVGHGLSYPIWVPPGSEYAGLAGVDVSRALAAGLTFRPVETTARDTLAWHASLPRDLQASVLPPALSLEKEAEVLALWRQRED